MTRLYFLQKVNCLIKERDLLKGSCDSKVAIDITKNIWSSNQMFLYRPLVVADIQSNHRL